MIYFYITAVILFVILVFLCVFFAKKTMKLKKEKRELQLAISRQKEIISAFNKTNKEAMLQKEKLGKGSATDRLKSSLDILQNIELNK